MTDAFADTGGKCLIGDVEMVPLLGVQLADHSGLREEHQPRRNGVGRGFSRSANKQALSSLAFWFTNGREPVAQSADLS
jgi:hypothetical protein